MVLYYSFGVFVIFKGDSISLFQSYYDRGSLGDGEGDRFFFPLHDMEGNWITNWSTGLCLAALRCSGREREGKGGKGRERVRALTAMEVGPRLSASCSDSY